MLKMSWGDLPKWQHLLSLLNDVLDLSKIAADKLELNCSDVNLDSLMADVYTLMRVSALDKTYRLSLSPQVCL